MNCKNILWIVSWYPSNEDKFLGDFIQRHARAAAIHHNIYVIYVCESENRNSEEVNRATGLTEQIIYISKRNGLLNKVMKQWRWRSAYLKAVENYITKIGKPDIVHVHIPWKAGLIALHLKKRYQFTYVLTEHWGIYNDTVADNFSSQPVYRRNFIAAVFKNAQLFISVSRFLVKSVTKILGQKEYRIIPNVVDTTLFYYTPSKKEPFTFIHVSNMVPLKNVEGILKAYRHLKNTSAFNSRLLLIGNKQKELEFHQEYKDLINKNIFFIGEISYAEVASYMRESHCLVMNSIMENAPCVISEALCCGLPVIATSVGGIPEMVNETNGTLIPVNDDDALMNAMKDMVSNYNSVKLEEISKHAIGTYSYGSISSAFDELYNSLL